MISKSPSGALSPYYYKGGYFHSIHYGSYFDDMEAFGHMMESEESFIMRSPQRRRIMIDLYETNLTESMLLAFAMHIKRMSDRIIKLAIAAEKKDLRRIRKIMTKTNALNKSRIYFCPDMETGKTWLVSDEQHAGFGCN